MAIALRQPLTAVKIGNINSDKTADWSHPGPRTRNQHEGVLAHFRRHPAAWICGDPFEEPDRPGQKYKCGFAVAYYDIEGRMCGFWVHPDGRVEGFGVEGGADLSFTAFATIKEYGMFRGGE